MPAPALAPRLLLFVALAALFTITRTVRADSERAPGPSAPGQVVLYTIGPGDDLESRWGHSFLCMSRNAADAAPTAPREGTCYDYGVLDGTDFADAAWRTLRGDATFVTKSLNEQWVVDVFRAQGRSIDRQTIPMTDEQRAALAARLAKDVDSHFAYQPRMKNCTTAIRDRLDEATGGVLRPGPLGEVARTYRQSLEQGLRGRLPELTALALTLGTPSERRPTPWESMFEPAVLEAAVADRFAAVPLHVDPQRAAVAIGSPHAGRGFLCLLGVLLSLAFARIGRTRPQAALSCIGITLGAFALFADGVAMVVAWDELVRNVSLAVLWPTDVALAFFPRRTLLLYARLRVAVAATFALLAVGGVVPFPVLFVCLLVALPFVTLLLKLRDPQALAPRTQLATAG
jgi:hypothetical protein